ncbi:MULTISPECIES: BrxA/BrxB family bacilliredoxin [Macrococcus]|uniref:BrxA/BrxB family bacilliredoxin n=1 Tax=Macrococcus psychrotolerans TaxID=3039389 RepID=A0AAU6RHZ5_9STAP|nr:MULTISPECIES: BrxA/BrxB family bacilliredoxin [Macrococcus]MDJ1111251.1 BrxA/BrxB family bacilliredoxin [Macrococcus sp. S115]QYA31930.1 BrxA/BrxB family bacilliredoxin [Macrococcus sp. 19Msa1099]QYA36736.1 BrxA/BrxB family bacilliredoxin [Macrococcus caseolyticus]QYA75444.1 BrxA/BrxB family bacilliredoxin [Macrococcus caseolyticus]
MDMNFNMYMEDFVNTARQEIENAGYKQLTTSEAVNETFDKPGTTFVMINSVCGCAGGIARPAAAHAVHYDKLPDQLVTVFAGQDKEATATAREYFEGYPPSSPSFALLKDGKIISMIERHEIEGHDPMSVITNIQALFEEHCEER